MKHVIDIVTKAIIEVPDDYICCSICGEWHPAPSYSDTATYSQTRLNCIGCYESPVESWEGKKAAVKEFEKSPERAKLSQQLKEEALFRNSLTVEEMITLLSKLPPTDRLVITQDGYYADGDIADLFAPEKYKETSLGTIWCIGHSSQHY